MRKLTAAAVVAVAMICAPAALAATASPTVAASAPTAISDTAATLHGTINPNGLATTYEFEYGPTTSLGKAAPATPGSVGAGIKAVAKANKVGGLSPDTTYYYELVASNSDGTSTSPMGSFKTTGNPAPGATTDSPSYVGHYAVMMVGTITPNNQATTYFFQYGQTPAYGGQTDVFTVPAGSAPVTVSLPLNGLSPGTVFHYRLVASHGATSTTYGGDVAFQTLPWPRPHSQLALAVIPRTPRRTPLLVHAFGKVTMAPTTPPGVGCEGSVWIRYYDGRRQLALSKAAVAPNCAYRATALIRYLGNRRVRLTVRAHYRGGTWAAPSDAKAASVMITPPARRRRP